MSMSLSTKLSPLERDANLKLQAKENAQSEEFFLDGIELQREPLNVVLPLT